MVNGDVAASVVKPVGNFVGYSVASLFSGSSLQSIVAAGGSVKGATQVGDMVTVTLQISNGSAPTAANFALSSVNILDVDGGSISGISASIAGLSLQ
ncbi:MAG TPA: hypothetical protein HPP76_08770 [Desulfuromonadales bacterium]|nr:hypothetical protein [Desulfuromonadales bacterium]